MLLDWHDFTEAVHHSELRKYQSLAALWIPAVCYSPPSKSNVMVSISAHQVVRFGQLSLEIMHSGLGGGIPIASLYEPVSCSLLPEHHGVSSTRYLPRSLLTGARDRVICSGYITFWEGTSKSLFFEDWAYADCCMLFSACRMHRFVVDCLNHEVAKNTSPDSSKSRHQDGCHTWEWVKGVGGSRPWSSDLLRRTACPPESPTVRHIESFIASL
jgi:hypothetical protein